MPSPPLRDRDGAKDVFRVTESSPLPARMVTEPALSGASKVMSAKESEPSRYRPPATASRVMWSAPLVAVKTRLRAFSTCAWDTAVTPLRVMLSAVKPMSRAAEAGATALTARGAAPSMAVMTRRPLLKDAVYPSRASICPARSAMTCVRDSYPETAWLYVTPFRVTDQLWPSWGAPSKSTRVVAGAGAPAAADAVAASLAETVRSGSEPVMTRYCSLMATAWPSASIRPARSRVTASQSSPASTSWLYSVPPTVTVQVSPGTGSPSSSTTLVPPSKGAITEVTPPGRSALTRRASPENLTMVMTPPVAPAA